MKLKQGIIAREIQGETVLLNMETGDYFSLNPVGNEIYKCISQGMDITGISEYIVATYDIDSKTAENDVISLVNDLKSNGIIESD